MTLSSSWHAYDHYGLALIAVVGTLIATVSIQWFIQASRWREWAMLFQGVAPPFININGAKRENGLPAENRPGSASLLPETCNAIASLISCRYRHEVGLLR